MSALAERPATRFTAPSMRFAPAPAEARGAARDDVRLLVASDDGAVHARFADLPHHLRAGDLLVVNDSATLAAATDAVVGERLRAGPVTLTLLEPHAESRSSPNGRGTRLWRAVANGDLRAHLDAHGRLIAYGYLDGRHPLEAYQSVFAVHPGSAEMASAGRPFTTALVTELVSRGIGVAPVTLHTGVSSQEAGEAPKPERFAVPTATARLVTATRAGGGRVVAVGTTVTRALESAVGPGGDVVARSGWTGRVVTPADPPRVVTGLVTGWHDPQASHLLLLEAVAGAALVQRAYDAAVSAGYLWHEFGDSTLFLPALER